MIKMMKTRTFLNIIFLASLVGALVSGYVAATTPQSCNPTAISQIFKCYPLLPLLACLWFGAIGGTANLARMYLKWPQK